MPATLTCFNQILVKVGLAYSLSLSVFAQVPDIDDEQLYWIADRIFANECARQTDCLTSWNSGEEFPSLGIGHFIWYPQGRAGQFDESFPDLLEFYLDAGIKIPAWLLPLPDSGAPWASRDQFYAAYNQSQMVELREFLRQTMPTQAAFILARYRRALPAILATVPQDERQAIESLYTRIASSDLPYGSYALVDYVNFKGEGILASERYNDQGWGLLQVLQQMLLAHTSGSVLEQFAEAAKSVLQRRVANAPPQRNEAQWLQGWFHRVETYLPP